MSPLALSLRFLQTQSDARLVSLARDGHERAFEALIRRYRSQLLAYSRRLASGNTSPEDILQQAMINAWKALTAGSEVRDPRAWLYRIVHNVAISTQRASGEISPDLFNAAGALGVEQLVEQRLAARDALEGLAALPELQRRVMLGTALDGHSHDEMASALGLTSGSVRGLIYRARATLRAAAAAVLPTPLVEWALRQPAGRSARSAAIYEAIAGGGSAGVVGAGASGLVSGGAAGLSGLIVKGSAVLAASALAGTAAIVVTHPSAHHPAVHQSPAADAVQQQAISLAAAGTGPATEAGGHSALQVVAGATAPTHQPPRGHDGSGSSTSSGDGSSGGSGSDHGSGGGSDGGGSGSAGRSTGSDGGASGGDRGTTTTSTTGDGGRSSGGSSGGSDGGSSGGSSTSPDGGTSTTGSSDGGTVTGSATQAPDTATTASSDGGSSDGGALATSGTGATDGHTLTSPTSDS
jgi:RNA polymerase sigma factor (sigma-70 family)